MRKFEFCVSTDKADSEVKSIAEFDDDITDEEIEDAYEDWMWEHIDTGWVEIEG